MVFTIQDRNTAAVPGTQSKIHTTDLAIVLAGFSGTGVVSGCGVTAQGSPDMTVAVAAGTIFAAGVPVTVTSGNLTVGTADATNPRIDLISASAAGVKTITAGTAAPVATCKPPDLPSGHVGLAFIDVPAADTTIGSAQITDKRVVILPQGDLQLVEAVRTAGDVTTTSTTFVDVTGMTVTLTLSGAHRCRVTFIGMGKNSAGTTMPIDLMIDGVSQGQAIGMTFIDTAGANTAYNLGFTIYTPVLAAGSRTIKLRWKVASGTGTIWASTTVTAAILQVVETSLTV